MSDKVRYPLRMPKTLYDRVKAIAKAERRSINQQLVYMVAAQMERWAGQENDLRQREESDTSSLS